ncbi:SDR family NAD(P)-dependent oxidoreductase [Hoyosella rhizosphaerae]|uniref:Short-chain dehydrogenase/reductase n=1 Tax=Hoyosella rhizosphaerae TaxID=1755582 RepID=A0A916UI02_9ACTN|nr:oxidoreductase [Hoyosella rhizosphaerae]MBN4928256.1 SDR family NAD(P)-dependent oxidoreductase [Hoyosella rhizosphaerae]GGC73597.1 putative short-chain dehydrogenase/reductase [Hoyosella rhizosphaerae]
MAANNVKAPKSKDGYGPLAVPDFTPADLPDLSGRTIVVTGGNGGLGKETSMALAQHGASVIVACRNLERAKLALDDISSAATVARPVLVHLDLGDLASVQSCIDEIRQHTDAVDVLINNAGVMAVPYRTTKDGFESQIGINHLGHFAFTGRMMPLLLASDNARVVTLTSLMHQQGSLDVDDLNYTRRKYFRINAYVQSKLANLLFTRALASRFEVAKAPAISVATHPGAAATDLFEPVVPTLGLRRMVRQIVAMTAKTAEQGAYSTLYAAGMPDVANDDYLGPAEFGGVKGPVSRCGRSSQAADAGLAEALWAKSVELTGVTYDELD